MKVSPVKEKMRGEKWQMLRTADSANRATKREKKGNPACPEDTGLS